MTEKETMASVADTEQPAEDTTPPSSEPQPNSSQTTAASQSDGDAPAEETPPTPAELEDKLNAVERQAQENHDRFLRVAAELDNFRKRKEREVSDLRKYANQALLKELLSVVDNLERALAATRGNGKPEGLAEGVEMTLKELLKIFDQFGVEPIEALRQPFDPNLHEAVMQEPNDEVPPNTVTQELQKGYLLRDRLLRPAMVVVSKESA
jgi:molecular chaperone GrpE